MTDWMIDGAQALGIGLMVAGYLTISRSRKRRRLAAAGDEDAKTRLEKDKTIDTVVAPLVLVTGICLLIIGTYADYQRRITPLPPEKAFEKAMKRLP